MMPDYLSAFCNIIIYHEAIYSRLGLKGRLSSSAVACMNLLMVLFRLHRLSQQSTSVLYGQVYFLYELELSISLYLSVSCSCPGS